MQRAATAAAAALFTLLPLAGPARAQVLARPGWAGSGVSTEAWWRNAVFYRIDVKLFQDSDGDGTGDLRGVAQRLEYLQALGVDAVVLRAPFAEEGFDDLQLEASRQHVRVIVELAPWDAQAAEPAAKLHDEARMWLTRGAAGVSLRTSTIPATANAAGIVHSLRTLVRSLPGDRILLAEPLAAAAALPPRAVRDEGVELVDVAMPLSADSGAAALNGGITLPGGNGWPLLSSASTAGSDAAWDMIRAAALFSSRGAVLLDAGQELGAEPGKLMPWTPTNLTHPDKIAAAAAAENADPAKPAPSPREDVYGAYVPYKPPPKALPKGAPGSEIPDFETLPGFTTGTLGDPDPGLAKRNAAVEEYTSGSVLHFYRRMIQLHHGNASLRNGTPYVLNHDAQRALVIVRRAPAGARTAATVITVMNLADKPVTLSLTSDLAWLKSRSSVLRPLAASWTETPIVQNAEVLEIPAHGSFVGELYHHGR